MEDKENEYVTKSHLDLRMGEIERKIDVNDKIHKQNYAIIEVTIDSMRGMFATLNDNVSRMVENQEETNKEIKNISIQNAQHELRLSNAEKKQESYDSSSSSYRNEVIKLVGSIIITILGILGTILGSSQLL